MLSSRFFFRCLLLRRFYAYTHFVYIIAAAGMLFTVPLRRTELTVERPLAKCETRSRVCCTAKFLVYFVYLFYFLFRGRSCGLLFTSQLKALTSPPSGQGEELGIVWSQMWAKPPPRRAKLLVKTRQIASFRPGSGHQLKSFQQMNHFKKLQFFQNST